MSTNGKKRNHWDETTWKDWLVFEIMVMPIGPIGLIVLGIVLIVKGC